MGKNDLKFESHNAHTRNGGVRRNAVVALAEIICRVPQGVPPRTLPELLALLASFPEEQCPPFSEEDLSSAHAMAESSMNQGEVEQAVVLSAANLLAAGVIRNFQWAEWVMGRLCECAERGVDRASAVALYAFVTRMQERFGFDGEPRSHLGLVTLLSILCDVQANSASFIDRQVPLEESVGYMETALPIAESIEAPQQQIAMIRLSLGRNLIELFQLGGNAELRYVQRALKHLQFSRGYFVETDSPYLFLAEKALAEAFRCTAYNVERVLNEPALENQRANELRDVYRKNARDAVRHFHRALKAVPREHPKGRLLRAEIMESLAKLLRMSAKVDFRHRTRLLQIGKAYAQEVVNLWDGYQNDDRSAYARVTLCQIQRQLITDCSVGDVNEAVRCYQDAVGYASNRGNLFQTWVAAGELGHFLATNPQEGEDTDWEQVYDLFRLAALSLVQYVNETQWNEHYVRIFRGTTIWFWEYYLTAAARAGRVAELAEILETRRVLASLSPDRTLGQWAPAAHQDVVASLPSGDAAVVYLLQGANSMQALIVHAGTPSDKDYICETSASWEAVRSIVDPWIGANQRLRDPSATKDGHDACFQALSAMLGELFPLVWQRVDLRLQQLGIRRVYIVRGRGLSILPLHAIRYADGSNVLDHYAVAYVSSGVLAGLPMLPATDSTRLLGVANPTCDLPWTEAELRFISPFFHYRNRTVLSRSRASKRRVIRVAPQAAVLHFACHGRYDVELHGLITRGRGQLVLADGALELDEVRTLQLLDGAVVILSACETGRTDWRDIESLAIADYFLTSGACAVVSTLWTVDDFSTALLMSQLYEHAVSGTDLVESLRLAQIWLRDLDSSTLEALLAQSRVAKAFRGLNGGRIKNRMKSTKPFTHPYYWAPFHVVTSSSREYVGSGFDSGRNRCLA